MSNVRSLDAAREKKLANLELERHQKLTENGLAEPYATIDINPDGKIQVHIVDRYGRVFTHVWPEDVLDDLCRRRRDWEDRQLAGAAERAEEGQAGGSRGGRDGGR